MKNVVKASAFSLFMLVMTVLYAFCDTNDDEFQNSSWAIRLYVWLFEHLIWPINKVAWFPATWVYQLLVKAFPEGTPLWLGITVTPIMLLSGISGWMLLGYGIFRWANTKITLIVCLICCLIMVAGIGLLAVDASIPFTKWTLEVERPDHTAWSVRFADKVNCEGHLKKWRAGLDTQMSLRIAPWDIARCISPSTYR